MSLKAKLEAVIYAAEEPVTLAQLAALFAADALAWKSAQESAAVAAAESVATDSEPRQSAEFDYYEPGPPSETMAEATETEAAATAEISEKAPVEPLPIAAEDGEREAAAEAAGEAEAQAGAGPEAEAVDAEAEEKRLARQRDRDGRAVLRGLLDELIATYASDDRGIEIKEIAGGYRMATKPECHDAARMFVKSLKPAMKLSLPALETLAVIAYKQPVTAPEVNEIRGVESSGVFGSLLARKLIATAGRKQVIGRPILYKTTKEFLLRFGLKDVQELPSMDEFEKMAQLEFEDMGPHAEEQAGAATGADGPSEVDEEPDGTAATTGQQQSEAPEGSIKEEGALQGTETAATADRDPVREVEQMDALKHPAGAPAPDADLPPAEAAPLAPSMPEAGDDPDRTAATTGQQQSEAPEGSTEQESTQEGRETAATADSDPVRETDTPEPPAGAPATHADRTPAEAAPAAPSFPEQAETETVSHE